MQRASLEIEARRDLFNSISIKPIPCDDLRYACSTWSDITSDAGSVIMFSKMSVNTLQDFISLVVHGNDLFFTARGLRGNLLAVGFINAIIEKTANAHFTCTQSAYGTTGVFSVIKMIEYTLGIIDRDGTYFLNTLIGRTPINNKLAIRFIKKCGATEVGVIKNGCYDYSVNKSSDALMTYFTRDSIGSVVNGLIGGYYVN